MASIWGAKMFKQDSHEKNLKIPVKISFSELDKIAEILPLERQLIS
tara:strand:- start:7742 stop:7879 length:138 start_codon:yes stop_codon:yes gene_type:complete